MKNATLNAYRIMWVFVFFDLPVGTKTQRQAANKFRIQLKKNGFSMFQFSVYVRHCPSGETAEVYEKRVRKLLKAKGKVSILRVTDKQFSKTKNFVNAAPVSPIPTPQQLEIF